MPNYIGLLLSILTIFLLFFWLFEVARIVLKIKGSDADNRNQIALNRRLRYFSGITVVGIVIILLIWSVASKYSLTLSGEEGIIIFRRC